MRRIIGLALAGLGAFLLVAALLTGCSSAADSPDDSAAALPGPVPEDVSFRTPPKTAPPAPAFDLTLLGGGLFLIYKATHEMHAAIEEPHEDNLASQAGMAFAAIIAQIVVIDAVMGSIFYFIGF